MASETDDGIVDINVYTMQLLKETCPDMDKTEMVNVANSLIKQAAAEVERRDKIRKRLERKKKLEAQRTLQSVSQCQKLPSNVNTEVTEMMPSFDMNPSINGSLSSYAVEHNSLSMVGPRSYNGYMNKSVANGYGPKIGSSNVKTGVAKVLPPYNTNPSINGGLLSHVVYQHWSYPMAEPRSGNGYVNGYGSKIAPTNMQRYGYNGTLPNTNFSGRNRANLPFKSCLPCDYPSMASDSYAKRRHETTYENYNSKRRRY